MGAGILALPIMMKKLGILIGSFNIILAALITIYSVKVLMRSKNLTNQ
jgi:amino acid permease